MLCCDIYKAALALLGENAEAERNDDYAERAPYILANAVEELLRLDRYYREAMGLSNAPVLPHTEVYLPLTEVFPLCDRFGSAMTAYLASALVINQNGELSDALFDRFSSGVTAIIAEIPGERQKILDLYQ